MYRGSAVIEGRLLKVDMFVSKMTKQTEMAIVCDKKYTDKTKQCSDSNTMPCTAINYKIYSGKMWSSK